MTTAQEPSPLRRVAAALDALMYASASAPSPLHETLHPAGAATSSLDAVGFLSPDVTEQNARNGRLPSDRLSYLRRLRTFRPGLWLGRPPCCDAVAAARHGWCAQAGEPDCLVCGAHGDGCGATLALILPPRADAAAVDEAAAAFAPKLQSAHKEHCPWKTSVTPSHVASFPPLPASDLAFAFQTRCAEFRERLHPRLPALDSAADNGQQQFTRAVRAVAERMQAAAHAAESSGGNNMPASIRAALTCAYRDVVAMGLCGWRLESVPAPSAGGETTTTPAMRPMLRCEACGTAVGLWNIARGRPPPGSSTYESAASAARLRALSHPQDASASGAGAAATAMMYITTRGTIAGGPAVVRSTIAGGALPAAAAGASPVVGVKRRREDDAHVDDLESVATSAPSELQPQLLTGSTFGSASLAPFHPRAAHRPFCPWINAAPAGVSHEPGATPTLCGWQRTAAALLPPQHEVVVAMMAGSTASPVATHAHSNSAAVVAEPAAATAALNPAAARALVRTMLAGGGVPKVT